MDPGGDDFFNYSLFIPNNERFIITDNLKHRNNLLTYGIKILHSKTSGAYGRYPNLELVQHKSLCQAMSVANMP